MSGFSPEWLALREPADHQARNGALARELAERLAERHSQEAPIPDTPIRVMDFGCGSGSNLRATAPLLGKDQEWRLVDYDPALLEAAAAALTHWADEASAIGDQLVLIKAGKQIGVRFEIADLSREVETLLAGAPETDLVTASALFDLISPQWMARFAAALAKTRAMFFTVLTYDGRDDFSPPHPLDKDVIAAFAAHQGQDKGFGPAAGPAAVHALEAALKKAGYRLKLAQSPWILDLGSQPLVQQLLDGIAGAVAETNKLAPDALAEWLDFRQKAARTTSGRLVTGHRDLLAWKS